MGASPQTPGVLRIEPMGWSLVDRAASKPPHDPEARGPFGAIRRSGCSPAEPYPADDPARFSVRLTPRNANREATSRPPGLRPGSNPSRWLLPGVKTPPNKQETVTDVVGQFVTHVPVRTPDWHGVSVKPAYRPKRMRANALPLPFGDTTTRFNEEAFAPPPPRTTSDCPDKPNR